MLFRNLVVLVLLSVVHAEEAHSSLPSSDAAKVEVEVAANEMMNEIIQEEAKVEVEVAANEMMNEIIQEEAKVEVVANEMMNEIIQEEAKVEVEVAAAVDINPSTITDAEALASVVSKDGDGGHHVSVASAAPSISEDGVSDDVATQQEMIDEEVDGAMHLEEIEQAFLEMTKELEETKTILLKQTKELFQLKERNQFLEASQQQLSMDLSELTFHYDDKKEALSKLESDYKVSNRENIKLSEDFTKCETNEAYLQVSLEDLLLKYGQQQAALDTSRETLESVKVDLALIYETIHQNSEKPKELIEIFEDIHSFSKYHFSILKAKFLEKSHLLIKTSCRLSIELFNDINQLVSSLQERLNAKLEQEIKPFFLDVLIPKIETQLQETSKQVTLLYRKTEMSVSSVCNEVFVKFNQYKVRLNHELSVIMNKNVWPLYEEHVEPTISTHLYPFLNMNVFPLIDNLNRNPSYIYTCELLNQWKLITFQAMSFIVEKVHADLNNDYIPRLKMQFNLVQNNIQSMKTALPSIWLTYHRWCTEYVSRSSSTYLGGFNLERAMTWSFLCVFLFSGVCAGKIFLFCLRFLCLCCFKLIVFCLFRLPLIIITFPYHVLRRLFGRSSKR